tara:strand:+ start:601 stop:795 length:195 start_codon:yes stop_codon:yes gene_type:complete
MNKDLIESDEFKDVYNTPFGIITLYKQDEPGVTGGKAGTSNTVPHEGQPVARQIKLKKKYRNQS